MKYEINIRFDDKTKRAWTGENIAEANDLAVYEFDESELKEQIAKAEEAIKSTVAKVEVSQVSQYYIKKDNNDATYILYLGTPTWEWSELGALTARFDDNKIKALALVDYEHAEDLQKKYGGEIYEFNGEIL